MAGDQQAALFGQRGFAAGEAKCTYGTGAFFLPHTGDRPIFSKHRLLTTLAATVDERPQYALEGSVFVAGAAVQWLRDGLKLFDSAPAVEEAGRAVGPAAADPVRAGLRGSGGTALGAGSARRAVRPDARHHRGRIWRGPPWKAWPFRWPIWSRRPARTPASRLQALRVDGGMARNAWFLQCQADLLGLPVLQAAAQRSTALGPLSWPGLRVGVWPDLDSLRRLPQEGRSFEPHRWMRSATGASPNGVGPCRR